MLRAIDKFPSFLKLRYALPSPRRMMILDTNVMNYAITSPGGAVIQKLKREIAVAKLVEAPTFGFCMTPFQVLEVLGLTFPELGVVPKAQKGMAAGNVVGMVVDQTLAAYLALPELSQTSLAARARERRSYLPVDGQALFDVCIMAPVEQSDVAAQVASTLAWDHALKATYPKAIAREVEYFLATLLLVSGHSHISRFRVAKRLWDSFYARGRTLNPEAAEAIAMANKAMRLKTRRDFLDCDLIHLACFGRFEDDVVVLTCDPADTILARIAVYKGMVEAVAASGPTLDPQHLPSIRAGLIVRCEPDGAISHVFPVQGVPTIV